MATHHTRNKLTTANLIRVVEHLVTDARWASAAKSIHASEQLMFYWLSKSRAAMKANDLSSIFWLTHRDRTEWFHVLCGSSRRENILLAEGDLRQSMRVGREVLIYKPDGTPQWEVSPELVSDAMRLDDLDWHLKHGIDHPKTDVFKRDANNHLIQARRYDPVPATTVNKLLEIMPDYQPKTHQSVRVDQRIRGSVQIGPKPAPQKAPPVQYVDPARLEHLKAEAKAMLQRDDRITRPTSPVQVFKPEDEPSSASVVTGQRSRPNNDVRLGTYDPLPASGQERIGEGELPDGGVNVNDHRDVRHWVHR